MAQRGAFCCFLMLASETGNLIRDDARLLRYRIQVDPRLTLSLIKLGLIERIAIPADSPEIKELRRIYSGGGPDQLGTQEGEGRIAPDSTCRGGANVEIDRAPDNSPSKFKQPEFKALLKVCLDADVRGSNHQAISEAIHSKFHFQPSHKQLDKLDKQIRDRRKE